MTCRYCKGTGEIILLPRRVPCDCQVKPAPKPKNGFERLAESMSSLSGAVKNLSSAMLRAKITSIQLKRISGVDYITGATIEHDDVLLEVGIDDIELFSSSPIDPAREEGIRLAFIEWLTSISAPVSVADLENLVQRTLP